MTLKEITLKKTINGKKFTLGSRESPIHNYILMAADFILLTTKNSNALIKSGFCYICYNGLAMEDSYEKKKIPEF